MNDIHVKIVHLQVKTFLNIFFSCCYSLGKIRKVKLSEKLMRNCAFIVCLSLVGILFNS